MVPNGWERKPIKSLCESIIDCVNKTAKTVDYETPFRMIRTTNIRHGKVDTSSVRYVTEDTYSQWIRRGAPQKGDVIFTREAPIGEAGILQDAEGVFLGQRTMMYRVDPKKSDNHFLLYSLLSSFCQKQIEDFSNGGTVAHMRVPDCGEILIDSPPLPEQQKIALILSTWDKAISTTEALVDNSKQQKKALMQQLLTSKKRLLGESGKPFEGEWKEVKLGDCFDHLGGTALEKHVNESAAHHFISIGNYSMDGKYIDKGQRVTFNSKTSSKLLKKGDLVMVLNDKTKTGDIIGSTILIEEDDKYIYNQRSERLIPNNIVYTKYFWYLLNSNHLRGEVFNRSQGGTQIYVNFSSLKSILFNLPCLLEQQKIASVLTAADKETNIIVRQLTDLKQEKKALMQQLLTGKRRVTVDESEVA